MRVLSAVLAFSAVALIGVAATNYTAPPQAAPDLDSLRVELVRARGFIRAAETQLTKTLGILDSIMAQPAPVAIRSVIVRPDSLSLAPGETAQLCAIAEYEDGTWGIDPAIPYCDQQLQEYRGGAVATQPLAYWRAITP